MVIRTHGGKEHLMGTAELSMRDSLRRRDALSARSRGVVGLVEGQRVGLRANATQRRTMTHGRSMSVSIDAISPARDSRTSTDSPSSS